MKILQKKGLQLRKQGQEIGKVSFLQTQSRRIVKERGTRAAMQLPDARLARAWETLPEMKKAEGTGKQAGFLLCRTVYGNRPGNPGRSTSL